MKTIFQSIAATLLSILFLTACDFSFTEQPKETQVLQSGQPSGTGIVEGEGEEGGEIERRKDLFNCSDLDEAQQRTACEKRVHNEVVSLLMSNAVSRFDLTACDRLPEAAKEACMAQIEATGVTGAVSEEELEQLQEALTPGAVAPPEADSESGDLPGLPANGSGLVYDPDQCAGLQTPGLQAYCESEIQKRLDALNPPEETEERTGGAPAPSDSDDAPEPILEIPGGLNPLQ